MTHFFFAFWPNDQMTKWPYWLFWMCLFLNKVLLGLRTLCQHGRRQAAPRHIKLRSVCKASWRSDAVLMPRGGASTEIGHRMWRRQGAQAPITTIVRAIDAILIRGSMAHGELWKTQTDFSEHGFFWTQDYIFEHGLYFLNTDFFWTRITRITRIFFDWKYCEAIKYSWNSRYSCSKKTRCSHKIHVQIFYSCSKKIVSFVFKWRGYDVYRIERHRKARNV